jgi:hypothetical protein
MQHHRQRWIGWVRMDNLGLAFNQFLAEIHNGVPL